MSCHVFISYRRTDSNAWAGRIFDRLAQIFPAKSVFIDVDGIEPGQDFARALTERLSTCKAMLVVIGPHWLQFGDATGHRFLDQPSDYVAAEIQAALERDIRVIPVLVDGARMPAESELPPKLRPLAWRQAVELTHARFTADSEVLVESVTRAALNEFPEQSARFKALAGHPSHNISEGSESVVGWGLQPSAALATVFVGVMITLTGIAKEIAVGPKLYEVSKLPLHLRPLNIAREASELPSRSEMILNSLADIVFDARWFVICGAVLALSSAALVKMTWRASRAGSSIVAVASTLACFAAAAVWVSTNVVRETRPAYDPERIGADFMAPIAPEWKDWIRLFKHPTYLDSVEFATVLSAALALAGVALALYQLRYVVRRLRANSAMLKAK